MVGEDEMQRIMLSGAGLQQVARELVVAANAAGGDDNVTAIVFRIGDGVTEEHERIEPASIPRIQYEPPAPPPPPKSTHFRRAFLLALLVFLLVAAAVLGVAGLRWAHFVGASDSGRVAVYQGVPLDLGAGLRLYRQVDTSPVLVATLSQEEREALFDHELVSLGEAQRRVGRIAATRPWDASTRTDTGPAAS